ncbi:MAG: [FeFe] hydrogenase H-cluster radical SAM maturase HydE [Candidatus Latescibacterota bacterium]
MARETSISDSPENRDILDLLDRRSFSEEDMTVLLGLREQPLREKLHARALAVTREQTGNTVFFRGLIEFSNRCGKNCFYCGIRGGNRKVERYTLSAEEIIECALWAEESRYGSLVLQSGEQSSPEFIALVEQAVREIKRRTSLGITLCVGEQTPDTYRRFFDAGAHRYLLRIETSDPELYARLHPRSHSFAARLGCLRKLREIGFQVGTGVMIGLPSQTLGHLARDIRFFREEDIDMIGMGPYIIHHETPLAAPEAVTEWERNKDDILSLALNMIAVTRLALRDVNIASTTALQALHPEGRELGLNAGANVVMPVITPQRYRSSYLLYEGKPCIEDAAAACRDCLSGRIRSVGREVGWNEWGDSPHASRRNRA